MFLRDGHGAGERRDQQIRTPTNRMNNHSKFLLSGAMALCATSLLAGPNGNGRSAAIIRQSTLPRLSLTAFGYSQAELDAAQPNGLIVSDRPGFGSGPTNHPANSLWSTSLRDAFVQLPRLQPAQFDPPGTQRTAELLAKETVQVSWAAAFRFPVSPPSSRMFAGPIPTKEEW